MKTKWTLVSKKTQCSEHVHVVSLNSVGNSGCENKKLIRYPILHSKPVLKIKVSSEKRKKNFNQIRKHKKEPC